MGGAGSGPPVGFGRRVAVRECRRLSLSLLRQGGLLKPDGPDSIAIRWGTGDGEASRAEVRIDRSSGECGRVKVKYCVVSGGRRNSVVAHMNLTWTLLTSHGRRMWFRCQVCDRRIAVVYLPPGQERLACRHCHRLTYTQSKRR